MAFCHHIVTNSATGERMSWVPNRCCCPICLVICNLIWCWTGMMMLLAVSWVTKDAEIENWFGGAVTAL